MIYIRYEGGKNLVGICTMLKIVEKAPANAGNIFLRHRQACQKLRKTSPAFAGLVCCNQQK